MRTISSTTTSAASAASAAPVRQTPEKGKIGVKPPYAPSQPRQLSESAQQTIAAEDRMFKALLQVDKKVLEKIAEH